MNKYEFLYKLDKALSGFSDQEKKEIVHYYEELIMDARDSGDTEEAFINRLGSVETIVRTIRKDGSFVTNVKDKKDFQLRKVFDITARVIGYAIYGFFVITVGSIAFGFCVSGISLVFAAAVGFIRDSVADPTIATQVMYAGGMVLGGSLFLGGVWCFKWIFKTAKAFIEKSLEFADKLIKKIGENK
ncbi:MAG TPA: hypothetical protein DCR44_07535 [Acholeplasmatales bacterium]|nr:MAG: hypothetical protein A2Y16_04205 [Tenericutes bacterium GWF2_57_13]HAQ57226.1 hypothetical protein [Acholeplasmatales bacterium]